MWNFIVESILHCDGTRIAADFSTMSQNEWFASVEMHERASRARRPIGRPPLRSRALAILHEFMASKRPDASTLWRQIAFQRFFSVSPQRPLYCDTFTLNLIIFRRPTIVRLIGRVGDDAPFFFVFSLYFSTFCSPNIGIFFSSWEFFSPYLSFFFSFFLISLLELLYYAKKNARISAMHIWDNLILVL